MIRRLQSLVSGSRTPRSKTFERQSFSIGKLSLIEARRLLKAEVSVMLSECKVLSLDLQNKLKAHVQRLDRASDIELMAELGDIDESLRRIRQGLQRLALTQWDTRNLLDEWHEWERVRQASGGEHEVGGARQELLSSELRVRGIKVPTSAAASMIEDSTQLCPEPEEGDNSPDPSCIGNNSPGPGSIPLTTGSCMGNNSPRPSCVQEGSREDDWMGDWGRQHGRAVEAEYAYWNDLAVAMSKIPFYEGTAALALYKCLKHAHAEQRLLDRKTGIKRYRLSVFEG